MRTDHLLLMFYSLLVIGLYFPVLAGLVVEWKDDPNFSHGFLIAPFAGYLIWKKRDEIGRLNMSGSWFGMVIILMAALAYYIGIICSVEFATRLSLILWIYGSMVVIFGFPLWRALIFPMLFLFLMIPIPYLLNEQIAFPLKIGASTVAASLLNAVGIPVYKEGNIITLSTMTLDVADACSGIRSLMSFIAIGCIVCYINNRNKYVQAVIVLSAIPVAVLTNSLRIFMTGVFIDLGYRHFAEGFFHTFSGWLIFISGFILILSLSWFGAIVENHRLAYKKSD